MNTVQISGRLCNDVEIRTTTTGKQVCSFTVAVNDKFDKEKADFFRVTVWGPGCDFLTNYAQKGTLVGVEGRLSQKSWESKDGEKRSAVEIIANNVEILDWSSAQEKGGRDKPAPQKSKDDEYDPFAD